jgi:hypothetical protein
VVEPRLVGRKAKGFFDPIARKGIQSPHAFVGGRGSEGEDYEQHGKQHSGEAHLVSQSTGTWQIDAA